MTRLACRGLALVALLVASAAGPARADVHCRAISGGARSLEEIDAGVRLQYLRARMAAGARKARIWTGVFAGLYGAITVGGTIWAATTSNRDDQIDQGVNAGTAFIGLVFVATMPPSVMASQRWMDKRVARAGADEDPCALLADAERLLLRDADNEAFGRGPLIHIGNLLVNGAAGLVLGLAFGRWQSATITALSGALIGEVQALTQPYDEIETLARYRTGLFGPPPRRSAPAWLLAPTASRSQLGAQFALAF